MKLSKRSSSLVATAIAAAMLMTACGGSDEEGSGDGGSEAAGGGSFSIYIGEPENPLVPGNTSESDTTTLTINPDALTAAFTATPNPAACTQTVSFNASGI